MTESNDQTARPARTGNSPTTVTVACKIPAGFYMQAYRMEEYAVPVLGGGTRTEKRAIPVGQRVKINGPAVPLGRAPLFQIVRGFAMTSGVPADLAKVWMEQNQDSDMVKNSLVFVSSRADNAVAKAKEIGKDVRSNMEQLDVTMVTKPDGRKAPADPRWPARTNPNLTTVDTDKRDEAA